MKDHAAGVPVGVVEQQPSGERRSPAEPISTTGGPDGATWSSQARNQSMVECSDSATGRPIPRLANQAYPPPSAIGPRAAA